MDLLPVVDFTSFLSIDNVEDPNAAVLCKLIATCLRDTGCVVVRDPRVQVEDNEGFLDMMEKYFEQPEDAKMADALPQLHHQVGVTPPGTETPRCLADAECQEEMRAQPYDHRATIPPGPDLKWRFMWRIGPRPLDTHFKELNAEPVVPAAFPSWSKVMNRWGSMLVDAAMTVSEMAALGLGLPKDAFTGRLAMGPHLLAPTGSDLNQNLEVGTVLAGYHYDLNFITVHGRSRFPGLYIWLRDGRRMPVKVPEGCLLVQAGKQLEWLTGGYIQAGMHEVIFPEEALRARDLALQKGSSTWRVSSTVFVHVASDHLLCPLGQFDNDLARQQYPCIPAGQQVQQELEFINLKGAVSQG